MPKTALITGGAGFIASHLTDALIKKGYQVVVLDKLTYAANVDNLKDASKTGKLNLIKGDINDTSLVSSLLKSYKISTIFHLAAESHVDNSILNSTPFIETNIVGTHSLLVAARDYFESKSCPKNFRFIHVSTDEVFGDLQKNDPAFTEESPYKPHSPYSASKAAADHLVRAWHHTYKLPVIITNCSNNFGPRQHNEKLIPTVINNAIMGKKIPIYGTGNNIRDWLYVKDHCEGLILAATHGKIGETYCLGGDCELKNIELAEEICRILDHIHPRKDRKSYNNQIQLVKDRKGHDLRYAINFKKALTHLGYTPSVSLKENLIETINYYLEVFNNSTNNKLNTNESIDLANTKLNYEKFRELSKNTHLTAEEKTGFPTNYRKGYEAAIVKDIASKLDNLSKPNGNILDIGCGNSNLTSKLLNLYNKNKLDITLVDAPEILDSITHKTKLTKISGLFPHNLKAILAKQPKGFDYILCYSLLHYVIVDTNLFKFIEGIITLLKPGGMALIGDIPNSSKRVRFFSSNQGKKFHKEFMKTNKNPDLEQLKNAPNPIDDALLIDLVKLLHNKGLEAFIMPQGRGLPMHNRRDDLLITKF